MKGTESSVDGPEHEGRARRARQGVVRPALPRPGVRAGRRAGGQRRGPGAVRRQGVAAGSRASRSRMRPRPDSARGRRPPRRCRPARPPGAPRTRPAPLDHDRAVPRARRSRSTGCWSSRPSCRRCTTAASSGTGSATLDDVRRPGELQARVRRRRLHRRAASTTAIIVVLSLCVQLPFALGVALMLNARLHGRALLRVLFFAPFVLSEVVTGVVFTLMLQPGGLRGRARCRSSASGSPTPGSSSTRCSSRSRGSTSAST